MIFLKNKPGASKELSDKELAGAILHATENSQRRQLQEELYDRYAEKIFFKSLSIVNNRDTAKDLTHDVLVKIFLRLGSYRGDSPFGGWVMAVTYNHCISYLEKEKRLRWEDFDSHQFEMAVDDIESENNILLELQLTQLEQLLDELNDSDRLILLMRYQDAMPVKEIADILQIGESAVKMRLKRSRDRLAELFKEKIHE